jgi:hypothetical protein
MLALAGMVSTVNAEMIRLKDGTVINGTVVEQKDKYIVVESSLGTMKIQKYQLESIDFSGGQTTTTPQVVTPQVIVPQVVTPQSTITTPQKTDNSLAIYRLEKMISKGKIRKHSHQKELQRLSSQLPDDYNRLLYKRFEKRNWLMYSGLNAVPTLGSLIQGDYWGVALIGAGMFIGFRTLNMASYYGNPTYSYDPYEDTYYYSSSYSYNSTYYDIQSVGYAIIVGTYVYSFFRPLIYKRKYNKRLKKALMADITPVRGDLIPMYSHNDSYNVPVVSLSF